jgi:hypothetical protein
MGYVCKYTRFLCDASCPKRVCAERPLQLLQGSAASAAQLARQLQAQVGAYYFRLTNLCGL